MLQQLYCEAAYLEVSEKRVVGVLRLIDLFDDVEQVEEVV